MSAIQETRLPILCFSRQYQRPDCCLRTQEKNREGPSSNQEREVWPTSCQPRRGRQGAGFFDFLESCSFYELPGSPVKELRMRKGMTLQELADACGLDIHMSGRLSGASGIRRSESCRDWHRSCARESPIYLRRRTYNQISALPVCNHIAYSVARIESRKRPIPLSTRSMGDLFRSWRQPRPSIGSPQLYRKESQTFLRSGVNKLCARYGKPISEVVSFLRIRPCPWP